jgi:hypothetical protein
VQVTDSFPERAIERMKAFEVDSECSELALVLLNVFPVLLDVQRVAPFLHGDSFRNEPGNLPIQTLALLSESLPLTFLLDVHCGAPLIHHEMKVHCHS